MHYYARPPLPHRFYSSCLSYSSIPGSRPLEILFSVTTLLRVSSFPFPSFLLAAKPLLSFILPTGLAWLLTLFWKDAFDSSANSRGPVHHASLTTSLRPSLGFYPSLRLLCTLAYDLTNEAVRRTKTTKHTFVEGSFQDRPTIRSGDPTFTRSYLSETTSFFDS